MRVARRRLCRPMAEQSADDGQRAAGVYNVARKRMSEIMQPHIGKSRRGPDSAPNLADTAKRPAVSAREDIIRPLPTGLGGDHLHRGCPEWDHLGAGLAIGKT